MAAPRYSSSDAASALIAVIPESRWAVVTLAHGFLAFKNGTSIEDVARTMYRRGPFSLKQSLIYSTQFANEEFLALLTARDKTGSAENAITKMFPAAITEQRFLERLDSLCEHRSSVIYEDDRQAGHGLKDFTLKEKKLELPINVKNAGTPFLHSKELVDIETEDCLPIPAYKANLAVESNPNLLYVVAVDYSLIEKLAILLPKILSKEESIAWDLLTRYGGALVRNGEDIFVYSTVVKYWDTIKPEAEGSPFHVISARKAIRILQDKPKRTPGIGLRAWGTSASAEVNVHISIAEETTPWNEIESRITKKGLNDIIQAVNRKVVREVYDPEI